MIKAAKIIGTGLTTTSLISAGVGIGVVFGGLIFGLNVDLDAISLFSKGGIIKTTDIIIIEEILKPKL